MWNTISSQTAKMFTLKKYISDIIVNNKTTLNATELQSEPKMPSRPEPSSVHIVFFYFLFAVHFLPSFPIHCMPLYNKLNKCESHHNTKILTSLILKYIDKSLQ
jgi:hypothetical protein